MDALREEMAPPKHQGLFRARDGTPIFYEVMGQGRPLVFCYGLTCRRQHWRHQIGHLVDRYQIIGFDYRGHHASGLPSNDRHLTLQWCARDLEDLLDHLEIESTVAFGHSMGVPVLIHAGGLLGDRLHALVLTCGSVLNPFDHMFYTDQLNKLFKASSKLYELFPDTYERFWRGFTRKNPISYFLTSQFGFNPETSDVRDIEGYMEGVSATPLKVFHRLLEDYSRFDGRELAARIECPTLVVAGEDDCITPLRVQEELVRLLPRGELAVIAEGSHNAHTDFPDEVNQRIDTFLERVGYR